MHNREKKKIRLCELSGGPDHKISPQRPLTLNQIPATSAAHSWKPDSKKSQQEFRKTFGSQPSLQPLLPTFPLNAKQGFPPPLPTPPPPGKGGTPKSVPACPSLRLSSCGCQQGASIPERTKKKGGKMAERTDRKWASLHFLSICPMPWRSGGGAQQLTKHLCRRW